MSGQSGGIDNRSGTISTGGGDVIAGDKTTNVWENVTFSGVTVNGASTQEIAAAILQAYGDKDKTDRVRSSTYSELYAEVALYVDELRPMTATFSDDDDALAMLRFMEKYLVILRRGDEANGAKLIECLTTKAMLGRLYGQHLQLAFMRRRREAGGPWSNPVDLHLQRPDLTTNDVDQGHFQKAEMHIHEALKFCIENFGPGYFQIVILENELGLLHRDKGEYQIAARQFSKNMAHLNQYHSSRKRQVAACYFNRAIVLREHRKHLTSLYFFWAAMAFEESTGSVQETSKQAYRQQKRYLMAYTGLSSVLLMLYQFAAGFVVSSPLGWFIAWAFSAIPYMLFMSFIDCLFSMLVGVWAMGSRVGLNWPPIVPSLALRQVAERFHLRQARSAAP